MQIVDQFLADGDCGVRVGWWWLIDLIQNHLHFTRSVWLSFITEKVIDVEDF